MSEWIITSFEWPDGMVKNLPVTTCPIPGLTLTISGVNIEKSNHLGPLGRLSMEFSTTDGLSIKDEQFSNFIWSILNQISTTGSTSYPQICLLIGHEKGVAITKTVADKVLKLFDLCGIYVPAAPRVVTETFYGRSRDDLTSFGKVLFGFF